MKKNKTKNKSKIFRLSEEEFEAMDRILERTGLSFQRYIEFKIKNDIKAELANCSELCFE